MKSEAGALKFIDYEKQCSGKNRIDWLHGEWAKNEASKDLHNGIVMGIHKIFDEFLPVLSENKKLLITALGKNTDALKEYPCVNSVLIDQLRRRVL